MVEEGGGGSVWWWRGEGSEEEGEEVGWLVESLWKIGGWRGVAGEDEEDDMAADTRERGVSEERCCIGAERER